MANPATLKRLVPPALLMLGVALVLAGLVAALGFTAGGMLASGAAIAALLYAGAVWFGTPPHAARRPHTAVPPAVVVFDLDGRIVTGGSPGQPLAAIFPPIIRPEIERRCAGALSGTSARFACLLDGRTTVFEVAPVRTADGTVIYGILLTTESLPAAIAVSA